MPFRSVLHMLTRQLNFSTKIKWQTDADGSLLTNQDKQSVSTIESESDYLGFMRVIQTIQSV